MAFPIVANTNTSTTTVGTTHTVALPANISSGNLLMIFMTLEGDATMTTPAGWTLLYNQLSDGTLCDQFVYYKVASGSEGASVAITGSNADSSHITYRITSYTGVPEFASTNGNTGDPNSPNLTPTTGSKSYLWISFGSQTGASSVSAFPTSYTGSNLTSGEAFQYTSMVGTRNLKATAENPGAFTTDGVGNWAAGTMSIVGALVGPFPTHLRT